MTAVGGVTLPFLNRRMNSPNYYRSYFIMLIRIIYRRYYHRTDTYRKTTSEYLDLYLFSTVDVRLLSILFYQNCNLEALIKKQCMVFPHNRSESYIRARLRKQNTIYNGTLSISLISLVDSSPFYPN